MPSFHRVLAVLLGSLLCGCSMMHQATVPMATLEVRQSRDSLLFVLLPGRGDRARSFVSSGFADRLADAFPSAGIVGADAFQAYYTDRTFIERLRQDVVLPALRQGKRIWLVGVSMGGTGALLYRMQHPDEVAGVVLFAPYLGFPDFTAPMVAAGSLAGWSPVPPPEPGTGLLAPSELYVVWKWLKDLPVADRETIFLCYGRSDRFAAEAAVLATGLPQENVVSLPGGHDWKTWNALLKQVTQGNLRERAAAGR